MVLIQGAILVSSLLQIVLGFGGCLAIALAINLVGLSLFVEAGKKSGGHWGITALPTEFSRLGGLSNIGSHGSCTTGTHDSCYTSSYCSCSASSHLCYAGALAHCCMSDVLICGETRLRLSSASDLSPPGSAAGGCGMDMTPTCVSPSPSDVPVSEMVLHTSVSAVSELHTPPSPSSGLHAPPRPPAVSEAGEPPPVFSEGSAPPPIVLEASVPPPVPEGGVPPPIISETVVPSPVVSEAVVPPSVFSETAAPPPVVSEVGVLPPVVLEAGEPPPVVLEASATPPIPEGGVPPPIISEAGQWGMPTVSVFSILGMMAGILASTMESIINYYVCARSSGAPPPPTHAINRGITVQGVGCILAALWGTGNGTTSYNQNIAALGITKAGSRLLLQMTGILMILLGIMGKFGAVFITIPDPVIGGMFLVRFGMIAVGGISNLQYVELNSSRSLLILGFSTFSGLVLPTWFHSYQGIIETGLKELDQIIAVHFTTHMFIGGFSGIILDNTVLGTDKERGIKNWQSMVQEESKTTCDQLCYDISFLSSVFTRFRCFQYLPFLPSYKTI
ncbi:LOW QUALITY PROTEIN: uncharacterized protein KZ484_008832 [Pholidichthys leucotaenia]